MDALHREHLLLHLTVELVEMDVVISLLLDKIVLSLFFSVIGVPAHAQAKDQLQEENKD